MSTKPSTEYADVWYCRQAGADVPPRPPLQSRIEADVCVVGGGLAGLTAAHHLASAGRKVALVEARRIGWGASGRNGGFVSPGYSLGYDRIADRVGPDAAKELFRMSVEGMQIVAANIRELGITAAAPCPGILGGVRYDPGRRLMDHRDWLAREFGYEVAHLDRAALTLPRRATIRRCMTGTPSISIPWPIASALPGRRKRPARRSTKPRRPTGSKAGRAAGQ